MEGLINRIKFTKIVPEIRDQNQKMQLGSVWSVSGKTGYEIRQYIKMEKEKDLLVKQVFKMILRQSDIRSSDICIYFA